MREKGSGFFPLFRPSGAKEVLGDRRKDAWARYFLRPFRADVLKHKRSHGFRTARCEAAGASPAATIRRPVGADRQFTTVSTGAPVRAIHPPAVRGACLPAVAQS